MRAGIILFLSILLTGCALFTGPDNILWANKNKIDYRIVRISEDQWPLLAKEKKFDPIHPCFFSPPGDKSQTPYLIFVRQGSYVYRIVGDIKLKQTYEEYCLNHEIGHIREYIEKLTPHSKYAN